MPRMMMTCFVGGALAAGLWAQSPVTVELTPVKDNTLYQSATGSLSNGKGIGLFAGQTAGNQTRRALLAFDLGQIPVGSTVTQATLRLRESSPKNNGNHGVALHRVERDWGEGASDAGGEEGGGAQSAVGDATWIHAFFATSLWEHAGGDFDSNPSGAAVVGGNGDYTWQSQGLIADVQAWVDDPASNFGWIVIGNEGTSTTAKRFNSREAAVGRPLLTVSYQAPAQTEPGVLELTQDVVEVQESGHFVEVEIRRSGGSDGEVSAAFATVDGTAVAGIDYVAAAGRVVFADGEAGVKVIQILILDEDSQMPVHYEGVKTFQVVLSDPAGGAVLGNRTITEVRIDDEEDLSHPIYFPQFGNGQGFLSQIFLVNPDTTRSARARVVGRTSAGDPFFLESGLPSGTPGNLNLVLDLPPGGIQVLQTSGTGPLQVGSVSVWSDSPVNGVVVFGGSFGLAGVQAAARFEEGFVGPVDTRLPEQQRTGVAVQNLQDFEVGFPVQLADASGEVVAEAWITVPALGQTAQFVDELEWDQAVDFTQFQGTIRVAGTDLSAVMIQNRIVGGISQFATLPVSAR